MTASWRKDSPLQLWDYGTGDLIKTIDWNGPDKNQDMKVGTQLYCCKFSADYGRLIFAAGSQVNQAKIFDYKGGYVGALKDFSHASVALDSTKTKGAINYLAVAGGEGAIRVVSIKKEDAD